MKKSIYAWLATALIISTLLAACNPTTASPTSTVKPTATATTPPLLTFTPTATPTPTGAPQYGGIARVASQNPPRSMIPEINTIKNWFMLPTYDTLLKLDAKGEMQPMLATDWKLAADGKSLTLTIRKGVKFHDGTDLNAAAVKFNIDTKIAAKLGDFPGISSVDVVDEYTVRLNIATFQNPLFSSLWFIGGMMNSPTDYQKLGKDAAQFHPVGTGPFKFVSYNVNTLIKWERFDGYWQTGRPYLDGFEQAIIADPTTRELALRNGELDAAEALTAKTVSELKVQGWPIMTGPVGVYNVFVPDSANADSPLSNVKVRQAIEYALDKEGTVKALSYGMGEALYQMTPSGTYAYIPTLQGRKFDPVKAKQLLTEAGYPNGFKTTIMTRDVIADVLIAAQSNLRDVGIDVTIDLADAGRFVSETQGGWKNKLVYRAFRVPPDWLAFAYTYTSGVNTLESKSMLRPPGFQDLLDKAMAAPDLASKTAASKAVVQKIFDETMVIPFFGNLESIPRGKKVHNLEYYVPWGQNALWGPADVWKEK